MSKTTSEQNILTEFKQLVTNAFIFLIEDFGYRQIEDLYEQQHHYRDKTYILRYLRDDMMVEVSWYFAGSVINVTFIEPNDDLITGKRSVFPTEEPNVNRIVDIYTLSKYQDKEDQLLLKNTHNAGIKEVKKRYQVISDHLSEVVSGLATYTKTNAIDLLHGDTSLFEPLTQRYKKLIQALYPFDVF